MEGKKGWQELLPEESLRKACFYGCCWCVTILLFSSFRLLVTVTLLVTSYVLWTRKMLLLFSMQAAMTIAMLIQLRAYVCFRPKKKGLKGTDVLRGLRLLSQAHLGKMIWCVLAVIECCLIGSSQHMMSFFAQEMNLTALDMLLVVGFLVCLLLMESLKLLALHKMQGSLSRQLLPSSVWMRLAACAAAGQYLVMLLFMVLLLFQKIGWATFAVVLPFFAVLFFVYYYAARCYGAVSKDVDRTVVLTGEPPYQEPVE